MATINDLPQVEGISNFFRGEIYGEVGNLLLDKGVFGDKNSPLYLESLEIMDTACGLVDVVLNDEISNETKDKIIEKTTKDLFERLAALKAALRK